MLNVNMLIKSTAVGAEKVAVNETAKSLIL